MNAAKNAAIPPIMLAPTPINVPQVGRTNTRTDEEDDPGFGFRAEARHRGLVDQLLGRAHVASAVGATDGVALARIGVARAAIWTIEFLGHAFSSGNAWYFTLFFVG